MTDDDLLRDIGKLEANVESLIDEVAGLRKEVAAINNKLASMEGGKAALVGLLATAASLGGIVGIVFQNFWHK